MTATQTALIVPVPEAEPAVAPWRTALDRSASWGVPAHVTILYPFLPPDRITDGVHAALAAITASVPRFTADLTEVRWFGDTVVWVSPQPDAPFRRLTTAVWDRFPQTPPYGGEHPDLIPHLTVGHDAPLPTLRRAADAVARALPLTATIDAVRLIAGVPEPGGWHTVAEFPLGTA